MDLRAQREIFYILGWLQWGKRVKMSFLRRAKRGRKKIALLKRFTVQKRSFLLSQTHVNKGPHRIREI